MSSTIPLRSIKQETAAAPIRLHGVDTLRGLATVFVVLLHAGIPYMTNPLPHLVWPARDARPSWAFDASTSRTQICGFGVVAWY